MRNGISALVLGGLIAAATGIATTKTAESSGWTCSLTGKTVQACCCTQQKEGKLYCTLAKKTVESCCCKVASPKKVASK